MTDRVTPGEAQGFEIDCPCGGVMFRKTITVQGDTFPVAVECPRCGRTPLDLLVERRALVGSCESEIEGIGGARLWCSLPSGHKGRHRSGDGAEWTFAHAPVSVPSQEETE